MKYVHKKVLSIKVCEMSPFRQNKINAKARRESHFRIKMMKKKVKWWKKVMRIALKEKINCAGHALQFPPDINAICQIVLWECMLMPIGLWSFYLEAKNNNEQIWNFILCRLTTNRCRNSFTGKYRIVASRSTSRLVTPHVTNSISNMP